MHLIAKISIAGKRFAIWAQKWNEIKGASETNLILPRTYSREGWMVRKLHQRRGGRKWEEAGRGGKGSAETKTGNVIPTHSML